MAIVNLQRPFLLLATAAVAFLMGSAEQGGSQKSAGTGVGAKLPRVLIQTEKGNIEVELDAVKAPITVANFLRYVDGKFYDGGRFQRTVTPNNQPNDKIKIEVIQATRLK